MRRIVRYGLLVMGLSCTPLQAQAEPFLQLDILGGRYDSTTQTIVSNGPSFTLVALLTPSGHSTYSPNDTYFISAAISPQVGPTDSSIGSYSWNSNTYSATQDMEFGRPPIEGLHDATSDAGDLPSHSIFPTFFNEFGFQFSSSQRAVTYNTADHPGGLVPTTATTGVSYYRLFNITTSLSGTYQLHFDLYDTFLRNCSRNRTCTPDEDINRFAPFSHDAQSSGSTSVPEPSALLLLAAGLAFGVNYRRRHSLK